MKHLSWRLQQTIAQLGGMVLIGILFISLAGFTYLKTNQCKQEIAQLTTELTSMRTQPESIKSNHSVNSIAVFNQWFPERNQLNKQLRTLHQLASEQNLIIDEADYKLAPVTGSQLWCYQITLPLEADYKSIRRFITAVLQSLPNASISNIELKRTNAKTSTLNAELSFALYYREAL